ncbi:hypothetical protein P2318_12085 [Myxococcaceae bacterium GXIMD 01537]
MSRALVLAVVLVAGVAGASAPVRVGADVGLLLRQEGGGQRTGLLTGGPRASFHVGEHFALSGAYGLARASEGTAARATTWYHRVTLRPEVHFPMRAAAIVLAAGPALTMVRTSLRGGDAPGVSSRYTRLGVSTGAALDVRLAPVVLRAGMDLVWTNGRQDVQVGLGALFDFGGRP